MMEVDLGTIIIQSFKVTFHQSCLGVVLFRLLLLILSISFFQRLSLKLRLRGMDYSVYLWYLEENFTFSLSLVQKYLANFYLKRANIKGRISRFGD